MSTLLKGLLRFGCHEVGNENIRQRLQLKFSLLNLLSESMKNEVNFANDEKLGCVYTDRSRGSQ